MCPPTMADRKKQQPLPSDSHFGLYFHFYLSVSQRRPCECVWSRASTWQTEEQVMWRCWYLPGLSVFIPSGLCQLDVLDQWNQRREAGGVRGGRQACELDDNSLSLSLSPASLAWGGPPELKLSPSLHPLSHPSVAFKHSYAHACTNTQMAGRSRAHTNTPETPPPHSNTHTRTHFLG